MAIEIPVLKSQKKEPSKKRKPRKDDEEWKSECDDDQEYITSKPSKKRNAMDKHYVRLICAAFGRMYVKLGFRNDSEVQNLILNIWRWRVDPNASIEEVQAKVDEYITKYIYGKEAKQFKVISFEDVKEKLHPEEGHFTIKDIVSELFKYFFEGGCYVTWVQQYCNAKQEGKDYLLENMHQIRNKMVYTSNADNDQPSAT
jgi:hypothetical protein